MTQRRSVGLARILTRDEVTDPCDPAVQECIRDHETWRARPERRRRAKEEADHEQLRLTSSMTDAAEDATDGEGR